jgi:GntR family transcriptional repressor for pyruvate dehydrogenase complex
MIGSPTRVDKISLDLQDQIVAGKLKPGEKLPAERSLCRVFNVGRTTVREALKSLIVRGVVTRRGRGIVVADPETVAAPAPDLAKLAVQVSIKQLYEVRKLVEVRLAGWAATRATGEDIAAIHSTIDADIYKRTAAGNPNRLFHDALVKAVHNPAFEQIYESGRHLFFRLPFYWKLFEDQEVKTVRAWRHELACRWHEHILAAIVQRDAAEAEGAMFQHLDIMEKDLLSRLRVPGSDAAMQDLSLHPMLAGIDFEKSKRELK